VDSRVAEEQRERYPFVMNRREWHKIMSERERAKQRSREADERALASGEKSREQLQKENGSFSFPNARVIFDPKSLA
jgi:hypothetical protein